MTKKKYIIVIFFSKSLKITFNASLQLENPKDDFYQFSFINLYPIKVKIIFLVLPCMKPLYYCLILTDLSLNWFILNIIFLHFVFIKTTVLHLRDGEKEKTCAYQISSSMLIVLLVKQCSNLLTSFPNGGSKGFESGKRQRTCAVL